MTTPQAFTKFLADISPTTYQTETLIPARYRSVVEDLEKAFPDTSDTPFWYAKLMGSAAKGTIIRPIDDVDVLAVFSNENSAYAKYENDSRDFLYRVRRVYDGLKIQQVGARGQAVRVFFESGGHVDVAPVFRVDDNTFTLPAGDSNWMKTSPFVANDWFEAQHKSLSYHLKSVVRLLKSWNREHSSHFNSFHLETLAANMFSSLGSDYRDALAKFFQWSQHSLTVADPGGHSSNIGSYLDLMDQINVNTALESARERASRAMAAEAFGNHTEAIRLWRIILGNEFGR